MDTIAINKTKQYTDKATVGVASKIRRNKIIGVLLLVFTVAFLIPKAYMTGFYPGMSTMVYFLGTVIMFIVSFLLMAGWPHANMYE